MADKLASAEKAIESNPFFFMLGIKFCVRLKYAILIMMLGNYFERL